MNVVNTRSPWYVRYATSLVVGFVLLMAAVAVFADQPPRSLFVEVTSTSKVVHKGYCNVESMNLRDEMCLIYYDEGKDALWIIMFDKQRGGVAESRIILVQGERETLVWCRANVCL